MIYNHKTYEQHMYLYLSTWTFLFYHCRNVILHLLEKLLAKVEPLGRRRLEVVAGEVGQPEAQKQNWCDKTVSMKSLGVAAALKIQLLTFESSLHWLDSRSNFSFSFNGLDLMLSFCDVIVSHKTVQWRIKVAFLWRDNKFCSGVILSTLRRWDYSAAILSVKLPWDKD